MLIENEEQLSAWIRRRIAQVCDAEPEPFAKYVMALVKKDVPEERLRAICEEQLDVFLGSNTHDFVSSLFEVLLDKSYVEAPPAPPAASSQTSSDDALSDVASRTTSSLPSSTKVPDNQQQDAAQARPQRRRISPPRDSKDENRVKDERRRRSRSPDQRRRRYGLRDDRRRSRSRSRSRSPHRANQNRDRNDRRHDRNVNSAQSNNGTSSGSTGSQPRIRRRCRDFEEKGLCRRGDNCIYDHGPDPIVLDDKSVDTFRPDFNNPASIVASSAGVVMNPPPPGVESNAYTEPYNPEQPGLNVKGAQGFITPSVDFSVPPPPLSQLPLGAPIPSPFDPTFPQRFGYIQRPPMQQQMNGGAMRGFRGFRGRGRGRFDPYGGRMPVNKSTTIEVRRIPVEVNKLGTLNEHFGQFGDITNIQISWDGQPDTALITFAKLPDAQSAMKSQKPILDNRFIQVSWHKPTPPPTPAIIDVNAPDAAKPGVTQPVIPLLGNGDQAVQQENRSFAEQIPISQLPQAQAARRAHEQAAEKLLQRRKERERRAHLQEVHRLKSRLYEKQATELKNLFTRITKTTDVKVKGELIKLVKRLDESLKEMSKEIADLHTQLLNDEASKTKKTSLKSDDSDNEDGKNDENGIERESSEPREDVKGKQLDENAIRKLLDESDDDEDDLPRRSGQRVRVEDDDEEEDDDDNRRRRNQDDDSDEINEEELLGTA